MLDASPPKPVTVVGEPWLGAGAGHAAAPRRIDVFMAARSSEGISFTPVPICTKPSCNSVFTIGIVTFYAIYPRAPPRAYSPRIPPRWGRARERLGPCGGSGAAAARPNAAGGGGGPGRSAARRLGTPGCHSRWLQGGLRRSMRAANHRWLGTGAETEAARPPDRQRGPRKSGPWGHKPPRRGRRKAALLILHAAFWRPVPPFRGRRPTQTLAGPRPARPEVF
jgi:hypothetical protein